MKTPDNSRPVTGVFWMVVTGLLFVMVTAVVKYMGPRIPAAEAAFLRYILGLILLLPMLRAVQRAHLSRGQLGLFAIRGLAHAMGVWAWFFAMARIPIADVTAMNYLSPIYVTLGAALFLGEKLAFRRIAAVVMALIGALIILRPGFREVGPGHFAMLAAALVFALSYLLGKRLTDETGPAVVVVMLSVVVPIGLAPLAFAVWVTPTMTELALLMGVAVIATTGHFTMGLAFKAAPLTVTQPVTFLQLVWAVTLGAVMFGEPADFWVVLGGSIIMASVLFITLREAALKRRLRTPVVNATKL
ncbi:MAG: DMT family transporter [Rhodobacterales bacterium]|nr:DMT family transporter [Rhodobacterales bacterium]